MKHVLQAGQTAAVGVIHEKEALGQQKANKKWRILNNKQQSKPADRLSGRYFSAT